MSNLTRLQAVSSSLDTAIDKAENLPDASGGGGGSVGTCTVQINDTVGGLDYSYCTVLSNGVIDGKHYYAMDTTINDVICGSVLIFGGVYLDCRGSAGSVIEYCGSLASVYQTPYTAGVTVNITLMQD